MSSMSHYKLGAVNAPGWALNAVWETGEVGSPTIVWAPLRGVYKFKYCQAEQEEVRSFWYEGDQPKKYTRWKLVCRDAPPERLDFENKSPSLEWDSADFVSIVNNENLVLLRSDDTPEILLIEKKFLDAIAPDYIPNHFNIPVKYCRFVSRKSYAFGADDKESLWCEIHHYWAEDGKCTHIIPSEYMPCDVENDQGGPYCLTHYGALEDDSDSICQEYKGPKYWGKDEFGYQDEWLIPTSYLPCYHSRYSNQEVCDVHKGKFFAGEKVGIVIPDDDNFCDKYDGPLKIKPQEKKRD